MTRPISIVCLLLAMSLPALAQQKAPPPSNAPSPAEKAPLSTTTDPDPSKKPDGTAMPAPDKSLAPPTPPGAPPAGSATAATLQTLVPEPADVGEPDDVTLPAKPSIILATKAKKEDLLTELKSAFERLNAELAKAGIKPAGRPLAFFTGDDDDVMRFEAMIPITATPAQPPMMADGIRLGSTPSGKAIRFKHLGSYDAIVSTYEVLTAYLDLKNVAVQDPFVEEYVTDLRDANDEKLDFNIYALKK